ncbi:MAG: hypothetical protein HY903_22955 [Deltaproteobacteria bacterium]|nr:hypothetical protein [Deltaproteobacteria bacterium]
MSLTALLVSLALAEPIPFELQRLAVSDLQAEGVDAAIASTLTSLLAEALSRDPRYAVRDSHDLKAMLVHDREQQLVGCNDPACFVDLSKFVGAEAIVVGKVGKLGAELVVTASRIKVDGTTAMKATARAKSADLLGREMPRLAVELLSDKALPPPLVKTGSKDSPYAAVLKTHDDCHWAAVRDVKEDGSLSTLNRQIYQATFPTTHFKVGKHVPLDEALYLDPSFYFLGAFHSCFARQRDDLDAFSLSDKKAGLVIKASTAAAADLREAWREGQLELTLRFEIVGGKLNPATPYDWENCDDKTTQAFRPTDIAPTALIKITAAAIKNKRDDSLLPLHRTTGSGDALTLTAIPGID